MIERDEARELLALNYHGGDAKIISYDTVQRGKTSSVIVNDEILVLWEWLGQLNKATRDKWEKINPRQSRALCSECRFAVTTSGRVVVFLNKREEYWIFYPVGYTYATWERPLAEKDLITTSL